MTRTGPCPVPRTQAASSGWRPRKLKRLASPEVWEALGDPPPAPSETEATLVQLDVPGNVPQSRPETASVPIPYIHFPILLGGDVLGVMEFFSFTI